MDSSEIAECALRLVLDGQVEEARRQIEDLRKKVNLSISSTLTSKVMIVEGCAHAYESEWSKARDRLSRALLLSKTTHSSSIELLSLAWLSYVDFAENNFELGAARAVEVLGDSKREAFAEYRAASVLASMLEISGLRGESKFYFDVARRAAARLSQSSVTSAVIFDIVTTQVSSERFNREVLGEARADDQLVLRFVDSSRNFDYHGRIRIQDSLHGLVKGQALNLAGFFDDAHAELSRSLSQASGLSKNTFAQLKCELLWADLNRRSDGHDRLLIDELVNAASGLVDDDDLAVTFARAARQYERLNVLDLAHVLSERSKACASSVIEWRERFSQHLLELIAQLEA